MSAPATLEPPLQTAGRPLLPQAVWFTAEQLATLPDDDGIAREIIDGRLCEKPMSFRGYPHTRTTARLTQQLLNWLDGQPEPRGATLASDAAFRLRRHPDTTAGADVAYISAVQRASATPETFVLEGPPVLAVEIYSPSDEHERVMRKVDHYLQAGAALVWLVDPGFRTVTVYRPDAAPELFNETHELTAGPHLPGFRVAVAEIFA